MSIDVSIKQKGFFKKVMPLNIILDNNLNFGTYGDDGIRFIEDEMEADYFIAYNSNYKGRGFVVNWNKNEKDVIVLSAPIPSHPEELNDFFDTVKRMCDYWKCDLEVDGIVTHAREFLSKKEEFQKFNIDTFKNIINEIVSGIKQNYTLPCVMFPLTLGKQEAIRFDRNIDEFLIWMHNMQSVDAYYGIPKFYQNNNDDIISMHFLSEETRSIFPYNPDEQIDLINIIGNSDIKCDENWISLYSFTENKTLDSIPFKRFIEYIGDQYERFDDKHIIVNELSLAEMKEMIG